MTCVDWRTVSPQALAARYGLETAWWRQHLEWDTRDGWTEIERARVTGLVPGAVVRDASGSINALAYGLVEDGVAQIGPISAEGDDHAAVVLASLMHTCQARGATSASYFGPESAAVSAALRHCQFSTRAFSYLGRAVADASHTSDEAITSWRPADIEPVSALLREAYGPSGRHFAPRLRSDEWERYLRNVIAFCGCGRFDASSTCVARDRQGPFGVVLVTAVSPGVAHLAQVAVHPSRQREGWAGRLVDAALSRLAAAGYRRATLLVDREGPAAKLYQARGFAEVAPFTAAWWDL